MEESQLDVFVRLLRRLDQEGVLSHVMLIGSWCLPLYRTALDKASAMPVLRTSDADILIPHQRLIRREVDVSALLKEMGFVQTPVGSSGWVVYDRPELRVEFLAPELGKGHDHALSIRKWHINAQRLRYLNLLADYPRKLLYKGLSVCVPEPAAFALQKFIVSARRLKEGKRQKDLETAIAVLAYVNTTPLERSKLKKILKELPGSWLKTLEGLASKHSPELLGIMREAAA